MKIDFSEFFINKKSAQKSRQDCERPIDSVKLIPHKVRKSPMPHYTTYYCIQSKLPKLSFSLHHGN